MADIYQKYDDKSGEFADFGDLKARQDLGFVEDTDIAEHTIAAGQYVIWKGNLYTANSAITPDTVLSTSNLTAVSNGGLNSLYEIIAKPIKYKSGSVGGEVSTQDAGNGITILSTTVNITNSAFFIASINGVFNITSGTMQLRMADNSTYYTLFNTNLTGSSLRSGKVIGSLSAGTHTIKLYATPQGGGYTLKIPSYNSAYGQIIIIEQSSELLQ